jgi:hypothetical protein
MALRLRAEDAGDLEVISATLQDAVFVVGDLAYDSRGRRFTAELNRFRWEAAKRKGRGERIRSVLAVESVLGVKSRHVRLASKEATGVLLQLQFQAAEEAPAGVLALTLAGGGEIRLDAECLDVSLTDVGTPWATPNRPDHERA